MTIDELERRVEKLRSRPLMILCKTPEGLERVMTVRECCQTGSRYICINASSLDTLLATALEDRDIPKSVENARKCQQKKGRNRTFPTP